MIYTVNKKYINWIDKLGEISLYLFIISLFIDTKLGLKVGYVLQGAAILKIIFDFKNIEIKGKNIYISFIFIFLIGSIFNLISSGYLGVYEFMSQNLSFLYGVILLLFIKNKKNMINIFYALLLGGTILSSGTIFNLKFIKLDIIHIRVMLLLATIFIMIYWLELLKKIIFYKKNENKFIFLLSSLIIPLFFKAIETSMSRMAFVTIVGIIIIYFFYSLIELRKFWKIFLLVGFLGVSMGYFLYPKINNSYKNKISTSFNTKNNYSNIWRIIMWEGSIKAFKSSPIIGVGSLFEKKLPFNKEAAKENMVGKYKKNANAIRESFIVEEQFPEAHSIYFNFLSNVGSLILLYLYLFFYQIPIKFLKGNKSTISVASFFTVLSFLIYGLTWSVWAYYGSAQKLFQILLGLLIVSSEYLKSKN